MFSRREFLAVSGAAIAQMTLPVRAENYGPASGCHLTGPVAGLGIGSESVVPTLQADQKLITSSGRADIDHYLGLALLRLSNEFNVYPGFGFFDEGRTENAFATPETQIGGTHGTVIFGLHLFRDAMHEYRDRGVAVIAVCAHEFGHIYQYFNGYFDKLTKQQYPNQTVPPVKLAELHADYLAGYFLAGRKAAYPWLDLQGAGALFDSFGDNDFTNPQHHGTATQRVRSIEEGFKYGRSEQHPIEIAAATGAEFVLKEFG
jgi:hypothetical protein